MKKKNLLLVAGVIFVVVLLVVGFWLARGGLVVEDRVGEEIELTGTVTELPQKIDGLARLGVDLTVNGQRVPVVVAFDFGRGKR